MVSFRGEKGVGHSQIGHRILGKTSVIIFHLFQVISILQNIYLKKDQYQFHVELKLPLYCHFLSQLFAI